MTDPPATRSKRKASEQPIQSIESTSSSVAGSRPSSSGQSKGFEFAHPGSIAKDSHDPSDLESQPTTRSKKRKLQEGDNSVASSVSGDAPSSIENRLTNMSRATSEVTGMQTRSASGSVAPSMKSNQTTDAILTPAGDFTSENADTPATNADSPPENADEEPDIQPIRRGRPPNRGRGRGRGSRGGRGGFSRTNSAMMKKFGPKKTTSGRGRGGRGKKTSSIQRVQAAFDRQKDLKAAFKSVSKFVRDGLVIIADQNLDKMRDEPDYYKEQPEYLQVQSRLDHVRNQRVTTLNNMYDWEKERLDNILRMKNIYETKISNSRMEDVQDKFMDKIEEAILHLEVKTRPKPTPFNDLDDSATVVQEKSLYRYHPWVDEELSPSSKVNASNSFASIPDGVPGSGSGRSRGARRSSRRERGDPSGDGIVRRKGLLSAANAMEVADGDEDEDAQEVPEVDDQGSSTPAAKGDNPLDEYGSFVPNRRKIGRANTPNNRIVMKETFKFDQDEIGPRCMSAEGLIPVLKVPGYPVPRHQYPRDATDGNVYYDQLYLGMIDETALDVDIRLQTVTHISQLFPEAFNAALIEKHGLHPKFGIPSGTIKPYDGGNNPDNTMPLTDYNNPEPIKGPTDFSKPLPRAVFNSFMGSDEKKFYDVSRSARSINTEADWAVLQLKLDMQKALKVIGEFNPTSNGLATFDATARDNADAQLAIYRIIFAAEHVEKQSAPSTIKEAYPSEFPQSDMRSAAAPMPVFSTPSKPMKKSKSARPLSSHGFDKFDEVERPAPDTFKRLSPPRGDPHALARLADTAEMVQAAELGRQAARRSPAPPPAKFVHYPSVQTGYMPTAQPTFGPPVHPRPGYHHGPMHEPPQAISYQALPPPVMSPQHMSPQQQMMNQPMVPTFGRPRTLSGTGQNMLPPPQSQMMGPPPHSPQVQLNPYGQQMGQQIQYHPQQLAEAQRYYQSSQEHQHAQALAHQQHMHAQQQHAASRGRGNGMRNLLPRPNNRGFTGPGGVNVTSQNPPPLPPPQYLPGQYPPYGGYQGPYQGQQ